MHKLTLSLVALALVGLCVFGSVALANADILKSDRRLAFELEQRRREAELAQHWAELNRPLWNLATYGGLALAAGLLGLWAYNWHADKAVQRRRIAPDGQGRYALPDPAQFSAEVAAQVAALLVRGQMQAQVEAARTFQPVRHTVNDTPTLDLTPATRAVHDVPTPLLSITREPVHADLPTLVHLHDVAQQIRPGYVALGVQQGGTLLQVPFGRVHHFLAMADTGAGKTGLIDAVITQLHPIIGRAHTAGSYTFKLYAADYKRELVATWGRSPLFQDGVLTDPSDIADLLDALVNGRDGVLARYDRFKHTGEQTGRIIKNISDYASVTGTRLPITIAFLDELNVLLTEAPKDIRLALTDNLKTLVQLGRGAGYNVFGGSQYMTSEILPRETTKQFINRALLGTYDGIAARVLFGSEPEKVIRSYADGTPGRGLIRTVGQAQPIPFQALRCEEHDILDAMRDAAPLRITPSTNPDAAERSSTPRTFDASDTNAVPTFSKAMERTSTAESRTFADEPEPQAQSIADALTDAERTAVLALAQAGIPRGRICDQVFGHRRKYAAVKALLDSQLAQTA